MSTPAPPDNPALLCTVAQFTTSRYGDLVSEFSPPALQALMAESTRLCEDACGRRLVPFTGFTETIGADGIDPDEYSDTANLPMDIRGTLGESYASAVGAQSLVRRVWLSEYAVRYPDLWAYSNVTIRIIRSYGGAQDVSQAQILNGPEPDTGHLWFGLGTYLPVGSRVQVTYGGGYTVAIPGSLVRAAKMMAAGVAVKELEPGTTQHDAGQLTDDALKILGNYGRD